MISGYSVDDEKTLALLKMYMKNTVICSILMLQLRMLLWKNTLKTILKRLYSGNCSSRKISSGSRKSHSDFSRFTRIFRIINEKREKKY
jgi:hypothetical protein